MECSCGSQYCSITGQDWLVNIDICSHGVHNRIWRKPTTTATAATTELLLQLRWRNNRSHKHLRDGNQLWIDIRGDPGGGPGGDGAHQVRGHHQHRHHDEVRPVAADQHPAPVHHLHEGVREQEHGGAALRGLHRRQEGRRSHGWRQHVRSGRPNLRDRTVRTTTTDYFVLWRLGGTLLWNIIITHNNLTLRTVWPAAEHHLSLRNERLRSQHHDQCHHQLWRVWRRRRNLLRSRCRYGLIRELSSPQSSLTSFHSRRVRPEQADSFRAASGLGGPGLREHHGGIRGQH